MGAALHHHAPVSGDCSCDADTKPRSRPHSQANSGYPPTAAHEAADPTARPTAVWRRGGTGASGEHPHTEISASSSREQSATALGAIYNGYSCPASFEDATIVPICASTLWSRRPSISMVTSIMLISSYCLIHPRRYTSLSRHLENSVSTLLALLAPTHPKRQKKKKKKKKKKRRKAVQPRDKKKKKTGTIRSRSRRHHSGRLTFSHRRAKVADGLDIGIRGSRLIIGVNPAR